MAMNPNSLYASIYEDVKSTIVDALAEIEGNKPELKDDASEYTYDTKYHPLSYAENPPMHKMTQFDYDTESGKFFLHCLANAIANKISDAVANRVIEEITNNMVITVPTGSIVVTGSVTSTGSVTATNPAPLVIQNPMIE